jgi:hypothetical protein
MTLIGSTMMGEPTGPKQPVRDAALAEQAGGTVSLRNGCRSAGRGPPKRRSQAGEPMPATQLSLSFGTRNLTARCSAGRSDRRSRATKGSRERTTLRRCAAAEVLVGRGRGYGADRMKEGER